MTKRASSSALIACALLSCKPPIPNATPPVAVEVERAGPLPRSVETAEAPTKREAKPDFDWFVALGLRYGDTEKRVLEALGPISGRDDDIVYFSHTDEPLDLDATNVTLNDDGTIYVVVIGSVGAATHLRSRGIDDGFVDLVGRHRDELIARLGKPMESASDTHTWNHEDGARTAQVMAFCYDFDQFRCETIWLMWFYSPR